MTDIILFHSALGLRPAVRTWADALAADGHRVHTPDLYDGRVFDRLEDGVAHRDALGVPELSRRAMVAVEGLPADALYAGFSMGAASAMFLALTRPGARGLFLMHGCIPPAALGVHTWPDLPVELHIAEDDPWVDAPLIEGFRAVAPADITTYPGAGHLFADADSPDFEPGAAEAMMAAMRAFARRVG